MKAKVIVAVAAVLLAAGAARADFELHGIEQLTVNTSHGQGWLYDKSKVWFVSAGSVGNLFARGSSAVDMSGGSVNDIYAYDTVAVDISGGVLVGGLQAYAQTVTVDMSGGAVNHLKYGTVNISGGAVTYLDATNAHISGGLVTILRIGGSWETVYISGGWVDRLYASGVAGSAVDISGGSVNKIYASGYSAVDISGGAVGEIDARDSSTITLHGRNFQAMSGLSLLQYDIVNGVPQYVVMGTGILTGKWLDGAAWAIPISAHAAGATILAIPEPTTMSLLGLLALSLPKRGGLAMLRRRRRIA